MKLWQKKPNLDWRLADAFACMPVVRIRVFEKSFCGSGKSVN